MHTVHFKNLFCTFSFRKPFSFKNIKKHELMISDYYFYLFF